MRPNVRYALLALPLSALLAFAWISDKKPTPTEVPKRPSTDKSVYRAYYGDLHVHTEMSADAFVFSARTSIEDAYRFAQGEEVRLFDNRTAQIGRPLDFIAITDHSESFGEYYVCTTPSHPRYNSQWCKRAREGDTSAWREYSISGKDGFREKANGVCKSDADCRQEANAIWQRTIEAAEKNYRPGEFTTFSGFEFSPSVPTGGMLHRNVIFSSDTVPDHALSATEANTELDLWQWLDAKCTDDCSAITIPHNMNFSQGYTFARETTNGRQYSDADRQRQARLERLVEVAQVKGYSECVNGLGMTDEECSFESVIPPCSEVSSGRCVPYGGDIRTGLALGLRDAASGKRNSLKPGFIGSTDTHNGLSGNTQEDNYKGAVGILDSTPNKRLVERIEDWPADGEPQALRFWKNTKVQPFRRNPGGLAGAWSTSNTREALFDAFVKARTFATSGNRMAVRFAAGNTLPQNKGIVDQVFANDAKQANVFPMGASIPVEGMQSIALSVEAYADPTGPGLHEIQIVKVWIGDTGTEQFRIYSIFCDSYEMPETNTDTCPVTDVQPSDDCTPQTGGPTQLQTSWVDPDFVPGAPAYYYIRVFERPTCRWTTHQALETGLPIPRSVPRTIRERAWSSPIYLD